MLCHYSLIAVMCFYRTLTSAGKELHDNFLKALAIREEDNRNGKVSVSTSYPKIEMYFQIHSKYG